MTVGNVLNRSRLLILAPRQPGCTNHLDTLTQAICQLSPLDHARPAMLLRKLATSEHGCCDQMRLGSVCENGQECKTSSFLQLALGKS